MATYKLRRQPWCPAVYFMGGMGLLADGGERGWMLKISEIVEAQGPVRRSSHLHTARRPVSLCRKA